MVLTNLAPSELVSKRLKLLDGNQLAVVRYSSKHNPFHGRVNNDAEINKAKVIWAREWTRQ
jgi:hypothetical protein